MEDWRTLELVVLSAENTENIHVLDTILHEGEAHYC